MSREAQAAGAAAGEKKGKELTGDYLSGDKTDIGFYLNNWARWMRSGESPATLPKASLGIQGFTHEDTDGAYDRADLTAAMATDASIADLPVAEQAAIHHTYLNAVYRFPRGNYDEVLASATMHVQQSLERKGVFVQILDFMEK